MLEWIFCIGFHGLVAVKAQSEPDAQEDDERRGRHQHRQAGLMNLRFRGMALKEGPKPWPKWSSNQAQRNGEESQNDKGHQHDRRTLVRLAVPAPISKEHVADLAGHVEGSEKRAKDEQIKRYSRAAPMSSRLQDPVLTPEPGENGY